MLENLSSLSDMRGNAVDSLALGNGNVTNLLYKEITVRAMFYFNGRGNGNSGDP